MNAELTEMLKLGLITKLRQESTPRLRAMIRWAITEGMTFEQWSAEYRMSLGPVLTDVYQNLSAAGIDIDACLRAMYDEMKSEVLD